MNPAVKGAVTVAALVAAGAALGIIVEATRPGPPSAPPAVISRPIASGPASLARVPGLQEALAQLERRLERQRLRPLREYAMALEGRISELEVRCGR